MRKNTNRIRITARKGETVEKVADCIGRIQVVKITNSRGSRLVIAMNLEDDPTTESGRAKS